MKLVGQAPLFLKALAPLPAAARSEATVLLEGETGTGKELVARALHYLSPRAALPFVAVNCGCLTETLLEDELFGHERGAFTDAHLRRPGVLAQAEKGTLFLDEVDSLTRNAQVALLRVLQEKRYRPLGAVAEKQADVRVIAASNTPLQPLVTAGAFRADLYYRLCLFCICLPPLRQRREDILPLAAHFLQKHAPAGRSALPLTAEARAALVAYNWPGNVRELENVMLRSSHLCQTDAIAVEDVGLGSRSVQPANILPAVSPEPSTLKGLKQQVIERFEREYLCRLLAGHHGNVTQAARTAGKERRELGKLLRRYQIDPRSFQPSLLCEPR
jgi:DNA-binding NtrC family response regulator